MVRKILGIFLCLGLICSFNEVNAQESDNGSKGSPEIEFETTSHDFGKIPKGKDASYNFEFTNTGDAPLKLNNVKPSCGCTTPHWPKKPIRPGESAKIKAVYDAGSPGRFHKSITVKTNIEEDGTEVLSIKGRVQKSN